MNLSVLLVEDIELNVLVAKSVLEKLGHHVDVALNGKDAIKLFERNSYDIILLDINLPDMSGFDIASHLRQKYEDGIYDFLPPLVAFTANVMQSEEEYQSKGMDTVLRKPLVLEDLKRCFYHFFGEENIEFKVVEKQLAHQSLDLEQIELVVKTQTEQNLILFKHMMPAYLEELNDAFEVYSVDNSATQNVANIAHKIKGAAGSIGLITVQQLAEKIQCYQEDSWKDNIENWLDKLNTHWQTNVKELEDYLKL
ncbi:sensor histidine kinase-like protein [Rodentibacter pneumotropicus]|uniref:Sensor histidine kinase-like protein n=1 Tax=Rodentibacter pneumotropicus TaxID=758 RepID=A0A3S4VFC9_9PAST|nr:sensor histidine kinase-like protein [Rodentibacter pneumotropicus]